MEKSSNGLNMERDDENKVKENTERPSEDEKAETKGEERLYEPIRDYLRNIFARYIEKPRKFQLQNAFYEFREENTYLEIVGDRRRFSENLKREFDDTTLHMINSEGIFPDIVGYVRKKPSNPKEIIIVEIKDEPIKLRHIEQARFYQEIFNASFGLLISSEGIPEEKVRFVINRDIIRGKVIIAHYHENPYQRYSIFNIHPRFKDSVPEIFKKFCI
jgi:hypothetical protein